MKKLIATAVVAVAAVLAMATPTWAHSVDQDAIIGTGGAAATIVQGEIHHTIGTTEWSGATINYSNSAYLGVKVVYYSCTGAVVTSPEAGQFDQHSSLWGPVIDITSNGSCVTDGHRLIATYHRLISYQIDPSTGTNYTTGWIAYANNPEKCIPSACIL